MAVLPVGGVRLPLLPEAGSAGAGAKGAPPGVGSQAHVARLRVETPGGTGGPTSCGWQGLEGGTHRAALARIRARITVGRPEAPPWGPSHLGGPGQAGGCWEATRTAPSHLHGGRGTGGLLCPGPWRETPGTPASLPLAPLPACEVLTSLGLQGCALLEPLPGTQRSSSIRT